MTELPPEIRNRLEKPISLSGWFFNVLKYLFGTTKTILAVAILIYFVAGGYIMFDYIKTQYGSWDRFMCSIKSQSQVQDKVVRVVGGFSEGSGFFIADNQILTNFHVIAGEPSPKIIFPNGDFITPINILGNENADLAVLYTESKHPNLVLPLSDSFWIINEEPVIALGYPLGTDLAGKATSLKGNFVELRSSKYERTTHLQTTISLVEGMSGGPLVNQCGEVLGISRIGLAGLSLFIHAPDAKALVPSFTDEGIEKIQVDPSKSPEDAVRAFYTYLKARRMKDGYDLLSKEYLNNTNFEEWTNRFKDILDVQVIKTEKYQNSTDRAFVKFMTKNWVNNEVEMHVYEGVWRTIKEDGVYKMLRSDIAEVEPANINWFYE